MYTGLANRKQYVLLHSHNEEVRTPTYRTQYKLSVNPNYNPLIKDAMSTVLLKQTRSFQEPVIMHILKMGKGHNHIAPVLLVEGTGGWK